jgi:hypothetical protein
MPGPGELRIDSSLAAMVAMMTAVMGTGIRRNNGSGEYDKGDDSEHDVANLHGETPEGNTPDNGVRVFAAYDG